MSDETRTYLTARIGFDQWHVEPKDAYLYPHCTFRLFHVTGQQQLMSRDLVYFVNTSSRSIPLDEFIKAGTELTRYCKNFYGWELTIDENTTVQLLDPLNEFDLDDVIDVMKKYSHHPDDYWDISV